ncbi:MAG: hypothetical protein K0Q95_768 [Bacteroidota bacterium]|jgi:hypothetical protein|nr:hypothetical protein [Bacteroidota bacterium]
MKFNIGDKVRFLNEKGEGVVTKFINKSTVGVMIEEGFEIPVMISELVSVFDESKIQPVLRNEIVEEPVISYRTKTELRRETPRGIYIALSPENIHNIAHSNFNIWLINHTDYQVMFSASFFKGKGYQLLEKGEAKAFQSILMETVDKKELDLLSTLKIDVIFFDEKPYDYQQPISEIIKIKAVKLYKENAFAHTDLIPEKCLLINVSDFQQDLYFNSPEASKTDLSKLLFQKKTITQPVKTSKPHKTNNAAYEMEIDLHIEELIDNYGGMSNAEIVIVQLRHFQQALDKAINEHYRSLTVIHGVGNGRLKQEVRAILSSMGLRYHDGSYSKYGFGATEVIF